MSALVPTYDALGCSAVERKLAFGAGADVDEVRRTWGHGHRLILKLFLSNQSDCREEDHVIYRRSGYMHAALIVH